jgi:hypothetical protein
MITAGSLVYRRCSSFHEPKVEIQAFAGSNFILYGSIRHTVLRNLVAYIIALFRPHIVAAFKPNASNYCIVPVVFFILL